MKVFSEASRIDILQKRDFPPEILIRKVFSVAFKNSYSQKTASVAKKMRVI